MHKIPILDHITRLENNEGVIALTNCGAMSVRSKISVKQADNGQVTHIQ